MHKTSNDFYQDIAVAGYQIVCKVESSRSLPSGETFDDTAHDDVGIIYESD